MTSKKVQYYKVIDIDGGHHGVYYKVGLNIDPNPIPLNQIRSCGAGAIYFTTAENLKYFTGHGSDIAWITPISKVQRDSDGNKWKAHKIQITKILPFDEALPLIKEISLLDYEEFGIEVDVEDILKTKSMSLEEKVQWLYDNDEEDKVLDFIMSNKTNKKLISYCKNNDIAWGISWSTEELKKIIDNKLLFLLSEDNIRDLLLDDETKLLKSLMKQDPDFFLNKVIDLI